MDVARFGREVRQATLIMPNQLHIDRDAARVQCCSLSQIIEFINDAIEIGRASGQRSLRLMMGNMLQTIQTKAKLITDAASH